ncbi:MAG: DUF1080 domain-containing protein [Gemmataceae bacterium]|nr:DUF1080 domain-containing protein [Gemmataceae bacterium]
MKTHAAYWIALLLLAVPMQIATTGEKKMAGFSKADLGKLPTGWKVEHTGKGGTGAWKVIADATAPSKSGHSLAQVGESPGPVYNICVADTAQPKNLEVSVHFKSIKGKRDQGGGIVWRYIDADNYYVARFNPLENNYRLYKVVAGKRTQLATAEELVVTEGQWHKLTIRMLGDSIECHLNGKKILEAKDNALANAGRVGLWTKADAQTAFDLFAVEGVVTKE